MLEQKLWAEKYRPKILDECLLPEHVKQTFQAFIDQRNVPNLLLSGTPGIGKTTLARVVLEAIGAEYIMIPAGLKGNIDTLRTEIQQFASTISLNGEKKYVILDEADSLTPATQGALRGFIEEYSANCGFIFTCNFREKLIDAISDSRLTEVKIHWTANERPALAKEVYRLLQKILDENGIKYDIKDLRQFIINSLQHSNDLRRLLTKAQRQSMVNNTFNAIGDSELFTERFATLIEALKEKNFAKTRTWIGENADIDAATIYRYLYDNCKEIVKPALVGALVLIIAKYQYQQAFVADGEINLAACMIEIMMECL